MTQQTNTIIDLAPAHAGVMNLIDHDADNFQMQHELSEIEKELDLTPEGIESTALSTLYRGLCLIRIVNRDAASTYRLADALHNIPLALQRKDVSLIRQYTIEAAHEQHAIRTAEHTKPLIPQVETESR